ncbi:MAG: hypothetical protein IT290_03825 [Deltaproteobacteria bacterium]|nr:hypothetical protein [Deltaproteobacteria bacterium]
MTVREFKLNLFNRLLQDLGRVRGSSASRIECPICFSAFSRSALDSGNLTLEHIVPESLGGVTGTLTCRACNNHLGSNADSRLVETLRALNRPSPRGASSAAERFPFRDIQPSVLKSAYLAVFHEKGYAQILSPAFDPIRESLRGVLPAPQCLDSLFSWNLEPATDVRDEFHIRESADYSEPAWIVTLRLKRKTVRACAVILPRADSDVGRLVAEVAKVRREVSPRVREQMKKEEGRFETA